MPFERKESSENYWASEPEIGGGSSEPPSPPLSQSELEARLIYAVIVAGKSADFADQVCYTLWDRIPQGQTPLEWIRGLGPDKLLQELMQARTGNYKKNHKCLWELAHWGLNLQTCTPQDLEAIYGIGPKTSRFFILWTRPNERFAVLDVHILRWLRSQGVGCPERTPRGKRYYDLERRFIKLADSLGKTPRELDYEIWCAASGRTQEGAGYES